MPRKSVAALAVVRVDGTPSRLRPPDTLGDAERTIFQSLVASCDSAHFRESDLPLLCRYVEAVVLAERAANEMRLSGPVIDGKPSAWLQVQEKAVRAMTALSMRLRLSPQSRTDPKTTARRTGYASAYENHGDE